MDYPAWAFPPSSSSTLPPPPAPPLRSDASTRPQINIMDADQPERRPAFVHHRQDRDLRRPLLHQLQCLSQARLRANGDGLRGHHVFRSQFPDVVVIGEGTAQVAVGD